MSIPNPCRKAVYCALSDCMQVAIDTGNVEEARLVRKQASDAFDEGQMSIQQRADIEADFDIAFPDEI